MVKTSEQERRLLHMLNSPNNNNKCGECKAVYPTWASWNLGVFLCGRCASAHRTLGDDVSRVKSLSMENWSSYELAAMESMGNKENQRLWNNKKAPFPYDDDDKSQIEMFLRDKYINGKFRTTEIIEEDYNLDDVGGRHGGGSGGLFGRHRSKSRSSASKVAQLVTQVS
ncbi:unnamed protein product [Ambrosiozyma monospora]|uniref:Unnamed protein product n=1 Tax=Ambrosiozyma monospora TaxID=43982 RepID=A0ACB5SZQ0_AMBMO|nr:unnamed protein product [Ambrosiozyma monospora]